MRTPKRNLVLGLWAACLLVSGLGLLARAGHGTVTAAEQSDPTGQAAAAIDAVLKPQSGGTIVYFRSE